MNYFKVFFYVWKNSFSRASYYKDVLKAPISFSLKYFIFFNFLLSFIVALFLSFKILIPMNDFIKRFPKIINKVYPEGLEVRIRNGVVSTNTPEPYFISVDRLDRGFEELEEEVKGIKSDEIKNILVIDTNATLDDLKRYQTYVLLTKNYLTYYKDDGRIESVSLNEIKNFTVNQNVVRRQLNKFIPWLNLVPVFLLPFLFVGRLMFFIVGQLLYLLIIALVLFIGAKISSFPLSFFKAYQIDLHLATIIMPFFLLLSAIKIQLQFPFLKLILFTVIGLYILNSLKNTSPNALNAKKPSKRS